MTKPELSRAQATQKTLNKYRNLPFDWKGASCIHLARTQAVNLGHKGLPMLPPFRSATGARTAMRAQGCDDVTALLDAHFPRIIPSTMWMGDLAVLAGEDDGDNHGLQAVVVADGLGNFFGWHATAPDGVRPIKNAMAAVVAAWRL